MIKKLEIGGTKSAKEKFYAAKKPINIWDVNVDNIVISKLKQKLILTKDFIGIKLDKAIKSLVLIVAETCGYVKIRR